MENNLYHYGIKGMRWGVRRTEAQLKVGRKQSKRTADIDDPVKKMSDEELRRRVNRLQMEQQYSKLSGTDVSKGKKFVDKTIKAATTVAAVSTTAITLYNNAGKIKSIVEGMIKK